MNIVNNMKDSDIKWDEIDIFQIVMKYVFRHTVPQKNTFRKHSCPFTINLVLPFYLKVFFNLSDLKKHTLFDRWVSLIKRKCEKVGSKCDPNLKHY